MNFSQWSVTLGLSIQGKPHAQGVVGQHKADTNAVCFSVSFSYFLWGRERRDALVMFHSVPFPLFLGGLIFTLNDGLIIFYVSFFLMRKKRRRKNEVGV